MAKLILIMAMALSENVPIPPKLNFFGNDEQSKTGKKLSSALSTTTFSMRILECILSKLFAK